MDRAWLVAWAMMVAGAAGAQLPAAPPDWRDITTGATVGVVADTGTPEGFTPGTLRDGSVAANSCVIGHTNLNARFRMQFAWQALATQWEWPQAQAVAAVDLVVADPPTAQAAPVCVKVLGQDGDGRYTVCLRHIENLVWQPDPTAKTQSVRLKWPGPFVTTGLQIIVGHHQRWVELGDVRVWASTIAPVPPPPVRPLPAASLKAWFANPWADTQGGTKLPTPAELATPWALRLCRNDSEQAMVGLLNTGTEPGTVAVKLGALPAGVQAEVLAVGTVLGRGTTAENWHKDKNHPALLNLFTADQVRGFCGLFPPQFTDAATWYRFPTLVLQPGKPAYVWLRLRTTAATKPGRTRLAFTAGPARRDLGLEVLKVKLPPTPVLESFPYGGVNDEDSRAHHSTVNAGYRRYVTCNLVVHMNKWGTDFVKLAQDDPEGFRKLIRAGVDKVYKDLTAQGYRKDQILVEIWDEPNDANIDSWLVMAKEIQAYDPTALIYSNPPEDWAGHPCTLEKTVAPMAPYVGIWAPHLNLINQFPETLKCMKATGKPIWFYQNVGLACSRNEWAAAGWYRTAPWEALRHGLQGVGFWSASSYYGDQWDDFDNTPYIDWPDAAVVFTDELGNALSTRNWEAWREGIEDVAIGRMLQTALTEGWLRPADATAAKQWLAATPAQVIADNRRTEGATVATARAQALGWLNAAWDDKRGLDKLVTVGE